MLEQDLLEGNKYFKWYWSICNRAKDRVLSPDIYIERHHIYPKSIYGQNLDLVKLTAKEHYIVHLLLWQGLKFKYGIKDRNTRKMASAFNMMCKISDNQKRIKIDSKRYEFLKIANSESKIGTTITDSHKKAISIANTGKIVSNETRGKISDSNKNKIRTAEMKENISIATKDAMQREDVRTNFLNAIKNPEYIKKRTDALIGKKHSESHKNNNSKAHKGLKQSDETVQKRADKNRGRKNTIESNKRISDALKGKTQSDEVVQKRADKNRGRKNTIESNKRISDALKGKTQSDEVVQKRADKNRGRKNTIESNKRISDALKGKEQKKLWKPVEQYDLNDNFIAEYKSIKEAYKYTGIDQISACCNGKRKRAGGFIWKFKIKEIN